MSNQFVQNAEVLNGFPLEFQGRARKEDPVFVGRSPAVTALLSQIDTIAKSQASVFITGESGTGKEVIARLVHCRSERFQEPSIAVNCAALPKDVIENELFGHEREAFTGATSRRAGCFEHANGGTLFLDEIAEMPPQVQAKLLRAVELQCFRRLGGHEDIHVDVRIIAATNKNLAAALKNGELREDLYYRISVIEIPLPPLRERKEDIPLLVEHFARTFEEKYQKPRKSFSEESMQVLKAFDWPGNVRELKNLVEGLMLVCPDDVIEPNSLPPKFSARPRQTASIQIPLGSSMEQAEQTVILQTLASVGGNKSKAARILGMSRKTLYDSRKRM
jgi:DNA-binding NtrC family response regulator